MDNAIGLGIILSLQDRASAGLQAVRNQMTALRDVSQDMVKRFDEGAKQLVAGIASMAAGVKAFGLLQSTFGSSVTTAADFEQAMARVGAVSGATGEDFEKLSRHARDLGRDTQYSATQAANSQELLARAGFKTNEIISAMPNLLYMAGAEGMDLASAADIAANTLRGFNLEASEMVTVANVLAKTSSMTNTSISTLGESFKKFAPYASAVNISLKKAADMIGVIGDAGIQGSEAGTAVNSAIRRLATEPKVVADTLKELGISAKDTKGNFLGFEDLMKSIYAKIHKMGDMEQMNKLSKIFGGVSGSAMLALMNATVSGKLEDKLEELENMGDATKQMYDRMSATMQGAQKRLESASEGMRIAIGNNLLPTYTKAIDLMAQFKSWITQLIEAYPVLAKAITLTTAGLLSFAGAVLLVVGSLASIGGMIKMWPMVKIMAISALTSIRSQAKLALVSFTKLGASFSKLSVPIVGLVALAGVLYYAWRKNLWGIRDMVTAISEGFKLAWRAGVDGITEIDDELANKLKAAGIWDFAVTMGQVFFRVRQFWNGLVDGFQEGLDFLKEGFEWFKDIFSPVVESGQELLKFLGILKPAAKTQINTWKAWGQLLGRIAPAVIGVIAAFKGFKAITGIIGIVGQAITGMFGLIMAHPVIAVVALLVAAGIYLYNHWEEITEDIARSFKWWADWIKGKWQKFLDWWKFSKLKDLWAVVKGYASRAWAYVKGKWDKFWDWWDDLTPADVWAAAKGYASSACIYVKDKWQNFGVGGMS